MLFRPDRYPLSSLLYRFSRKTSGQPFKDIRAQPANPAPVETVLLRKPPNKRQAVQQPPGPSRQARNIMRAEKLCPREKRLIDPGGKGHSFTAYGRGL
jgi:hypothetical protein